MTMAKPGLAQDQTVEEILASIRQVINGEQPRSAAARPAAGGVMAQTPRGPAAVAPEAAKPAPRPGTVTAIHGAKIGAAAEGTVEYEAPREASVTEDAAPKKTTAVEEHTPEASAEPSDHAQMHDVIELAIEQALDRVGRDETRAEKAIPAAAGIRPPLRATVTPRFEPRPAPEMPRAAETQPARESPHIVTPRPPREMPRMAEPQPSRSLLSPRANAAVAASFEDLARTLASQGSRNIDETVEDLLRPMLKSWLEDNLPSLVERLVREEIERVSRGGR